MKPCPWCDGEGVNRDELGDFHLGSVCQRCNGTGEIPDEEDVDEPDDGGAFVRF